MKKAIIPTIILATVFLAKYLQTIAYDSTLDYSLYKVLFLASVWLIVASFSLISVLSVFQLTGKYVWNSTVAITGFILINLSMFFYPDELWIHFHGFSQIFLITALFIYLYPLHSYETRKFPAFGAAFFMIYVLLEYTSLLRNQYDLAVFILYLTGSLILFIPGVYFFFKEKQNAYKKFSDQKKDVGIAT